MHWFHHPDLVACWLADFISSQMRQLRPLYTPPGAFTDQMRLDRSSADIDSIELVELASALYLALDAEDSGALNEYAQQHGNLGQHFGAWCKFVSFAAEKSPVLWFQSSGSTGQRRWILHRLADLQSEVREVAAIVQTGGNVIQRVVSIMPAHHIYGYLFGVLLPSVLDVPALHLRAVAPAMLRAQLKQGDALIAQPAFWRPAFANSVEQKSAGFPDAIVGLSSGQALPGALFERAKRAGVRLIELYGATETAGIGWRESDSGFALLSRYRWKNSDTSALMDTGSAIESIIQPPDLIERQPDNRFIVKGRLDRVLQVSGQNVHLDAIEQTLALFPGIAQVRLRKLPEADPNARLHAFIVCPHAIDEVQLRVFAGVHLQTAELPLSYRFGPVLPSTEAGKECAWEIA